MAERDTSVDRPCVSARDAHAKVAFPRSPTGRTGQVGCAMGVPLAWCSASAG